MGFEAVLLGDRLDEVALVDKARPAPLMRVRAGRQAERRPLLRAEELRQVSEARSDRRRAYMLQAGTVARPVRPPAMPRSLVAVRGPMIAERLGASRFIRDSTYSRIVRLAASSSKHTSHARSTAVHSASVSCRPALVVAITLMTILVALTIGTDDRSGLGSVRSAGLPMALTVRQ